MLEVGSTYPFETALTNLKAGAAIARVGWNGKGMFLRLVAPHDPQRLPYVEMFTADRRWVPWLASQTDLLASDWVILAETARTKEPV